MLRWRLLGKGVWWLDGFVGSWGWWLGELVMASRGEPERLGVQPQRTRYFFDDLELRA